MTIQTIFINNFEFLIPEFFLIIFILLLLLYGVFFNIYNNKILLITKNINKIIMYFLLLLLLLILNIETKTITLLNGILFISHFTQNIKIILILITFICIGIQQDYIIKQKIFSYEINILILISLLGLMLLISSNNLIILYLSIELQSLSFYILAASQRKSILSIESSLKYFILGSIASGFILFGSSIIYGITGSINFSNIFLLISNLNLIESNNVLFGLIYGYIFILVGLLFKIGSVPFHFWLPDVYEGSPNNITSLFALLPKISFFGILIRLYFDIFKDLSFFFFSFFHVVALLSMFIGTLSTLQQKKIKRLLAFSSITHVGFILIGFTSSNINNIQYILFYVLIYIITNINLWTLYQSLIINNKPIKYLVQLSNIFKINKIIAFIIIINVFSLAGIPPLAGFFSKFFIFLSALKNNYFSLIFFSILISIISSVYYLKIIKIIFFDKPQSKNILLASINKFNSYVLIINTEIILLFFLFPDIFLTKLHKYYLYFLI